MMTDASLSLLSTMAMSRAADRREGICFRQGKGAFALSSAGHEALAAAAQALNDDDLIFPHYRDRALMLARGVDIYDIALQFFGRRGSSSGGRQLASHFSDRSHGVVSCASPVAAQCLPATGAAWAMQLRGQKGLVLCTLGEASTRQGEFFEAVAFALQLRLPVVFLVEDNGYGISTPSASTNPYAVGALASSHRVVVDGRDPEALGSAVAEACAKARCGDGPTVVWAELDRLDSHSASDDQRIYRSDAELKAMTARDPLQRFVSRLVDAGLMTQDAWEATRLAAAEAVDTAYDQAFAASDPEPSEAFSHVLATKPIEQIRQDGAPPTTLAQAVNATLMDLLASDQRVVLFGQDIEDPKGGIFGLTKGLSTAHPDRVVNAPLAEATIAGVGAGLAIAGMRPIVELQFIDFVGPGFNQIVNQIATLRWRSVGDWNCPVVVIAPCGGYLPSGGPWHSQTNEAWFAHSPGLRVLMPSSPSDAAAMLRAAVAGDDPVILLLPKHRLRIPCPVEDNVSSDPFSARRLRDGGDVTLVAWGNTCELALAAANRAASEGVGCDVIDLRAIVPCDWATLRASVRRTGRLIVVQEDCRTCSFGQAIITELVSDQELWSRLLSPPRLVSRDDVHVGFHATLETAVLPGEADVFDAIRAVVGV
jgi:2-oxoisovalerate dehydrogenase E1 component